MDTQLMARTAAAMVAPGRGLLAADESAGTCERRFQEAGVECTVETRRAYRELLFATPGISDFVSGVILFDETIRQRTSDGIPIPTYLTQNGIIPGIKVDTGAKPLALALDEEVTEGLDGLRTRLADYFGLGARFAKWRAVISIGADIPSTGCIEANAHALARYGALCQEASIVPIFEPEVLLDGDHSIDRCLEVSEAVLRATFTAAIEQRVSLEYMILKSSMVLSGKNVTHRSGVAQVGKQTMRCLMRAVPASLPGIVFLSGGQSDLEATAHLDAINRLGSAPWPLTFSFSRALQSTALKVWGGNAANVTAAQATFHHRARMNSLASLGQWSSDLESA